MFDATRTRGTVEDVSITAVASALLTPESDSPDSFTSASFEITKREQLSIVMLVVQLKLFTISVPPLAVKKAKLSTALAGVAITEQFSTVSVESAQVNNETRVSPIDRPTENEKFENREGELVRITESEEPAIASMESVVGEREPSILKESSRRRSSCDST
jgi:hypothetical protein